MWTLFCTCQQTAYTTLRGHFPISTRNRYHMSSPHIKGVDVCVQLYKCSPDTQNTLNMDVSMSLFRKYQKSLRWRLMRHTLLSSLAPQIINRQQSEVKALRTHTDRPLRPHSSTCLILSSAETNKRTTRWFLTLPGQLSPEEDLIHGPSDQIWQGFDLPEKRRDWGCCEKSFRWGTKCYD